MSIRKYIRKGVKVVKDPTGKDQFYYLFSDLPLEKYLLGTEPDYIIAADLDNRGYMTDIVSKPFIRLLSKKGYREVDLS